MAGPCWHPERVLKPKTSSWLSPGRSCSSSAAAAASKDTLCPCKHLSPHPTSTFVLAAPSPSIAASMLPTRSIRSPSTCASTGSQPPLTHKHAPAPSATRCVHTHVSTYTHRHLPANPPCAHRQPPPTDTNVPPVTRHISGLPNPAWPLFCTCISSPSHAQLIPRALPADAPGTPTHPHSHLPVLHRTQLFNLPRVRVGAGALNGFWVRLEV